MKLHLNLTLRRAVLAAMAMVALGTAQAETITYNGKGDAYITGDGTIASNEWDDIWNKHKSGTLTIGTSEGAAVVNLENATYNKGQVIFIGGRGNGSDATSGNSGTLNVSNGTLNVSDAIHVGNSQSQVTGQLIVDGGSVVAGSELTVGAYKGTGMVNVKNGGSLTVKTDADGGVLRVGYHNGGGHDTTLMDGIVLQGSTLTVGEAGGAKDMTSIGHENSVAVLVLAEASTATLHDQTIVGEGAGSNGSIIVEGGGSLTLGSLTVLGYASSAQGSIEIAKNASAKADVMTIGAAGKGEAIVDGNLSANTIILGEQKSGSGILSSTGSITTGVLSIGQAGTGSAEIKSGVLTASDIILGNDATGNGTLAIANEASVTELNSLTIGYKGKGELITESDIKATSTAIGTEASSATVAGGAELTTGYLGINGTLNLGDEDDEATGEVTVNGDLQLGSTGTINIAKKTPKEEHSILTTNGNALIYGSVNNAGVWTANGSTLNYGTITNDGSLGVTDSMTSWGTIKGAGSLAVAQKGDTLTLLGSTTQGSVSNNGDIIIKGAGSLTADKLTGNGTTTIVVDGTSRSGTIIGGLTSVTTNTVYAKIDVSNATALISKDVTFINKGSAAMSLNNAQEGASIDWTNSYINLDSSNTKLWFTATGTSADDVSQIKFTKLAELIQVAPEESQKEITYIDPTTNEEVKTEVELEYEKITLSTETKAVESLGDDLSEDAKEVISTAAPVQTVVIAESSSSAAASEPIGLVVSSNVTSSSLAVQTVVVSQVTKDDTGNTTETKPVGTTGLVLVLEGDSTHEGGDTSNGKASLGFAEGVSGTITAKAEGETEATTKQLQTIDLLQVGKGANVSVSNLDMHSTHALTVQEGATLNLNGVKATIGGSTDHNIKGSTVTVEVKDKNGNTVLDAAGKPVTQEVVVENKNISHLETGSVIGSAEGTAAIVINISDSELTFEKVYSDTEGLELGETNITGANTLVQLDNSTLGMDSVVLDANGKPEKTKDGHDKHGQKIIFSNGAHLKGNGNLKHIHMQKGTTLTVGSSPGVFNASELTVEGMTRFYIIADSGSWNFSGATTDANKTTGAISQLNVDKAVTLNGASITFIYQTSDGNNGFADVTADNLATTKKELGSKFEEGATIKFITGNLNELSANGCTLDINSLPTLDESQGLFWDTTEFFTKGIVTVMAEILEEPVRVADSLLSAGDTVLNFGRVAEAQAILRKAGTTRVWGSALGSFDSVDSDGARTGYDYNSWGGAVGVDHAFTSRTVLGVAFGCSWGENEAEKDNGYYSAGSIDQDATMIGLYGTHKFHTKGLMNDMKLSAFAAYGQFENSSSRKGIKSGHNATAEWDSDAWVLSASLSRDITTDSGLVVTPYVGVEYTKAGMDDFTEKGKSYNATYTADEDYSNLAVKVGVSVSKTIGSFTPYAGIAYINDVARDTPKVTASGKRTITGEASMPGRSAVQLNLGTGVKLSDSWDAYAGYTAELRSKATEHNVNVGVGYTF